MDWPALLREFGLPITVLVVGGWLVTNGIFVTGKSADQRVADRDTAHALAMADMKARHAEQVAAAEAEKAYREDRRVEERSNRLLTEEALRNQVTVMRDMTELLKDIERNFRVGGGS